MYSNLFTSLYDVIALYAQPALAQEHIFFSDQNRFSLPEDTEEYAIVSILSTTRHGTPVETITDNTVEITTLFEYAVQIEFCSTEDEARQRAMSIANIGTTSIGVSFFNQYGVSLLYATDPKEKTFVGDANQYVKRWIVTLHVTKPETTTLPVETCTTLKLSQKTNTTRHFLSRFEDVTVHHKQ